MVFDSCLIGEGSPSSPCLLSRFSPGSGLVTFFQVLVKFSFLKKDRLSNGNRQSYRPETNIGRPFQHQVQYWKGTGYHS